MRNKLLQQSSIYSLNNLFASLAGLITFPFLTKNLSIDDYGAVALFTITTSLLTSINKLGIQQSIIRFHSDTSPETLQSSIFYPGILMILLSSMFIYFMGIILSDFSTSVIFNEVPLLIITLSAAFQSIRSLVNNLLIANQFSFSYTLLSFIHRLFSLSLIIIILLYISQSPEGFIMAILIADAIITIVAIIWCYQSNLITKFKPTFFEKSIYVSALMFSLPLFASELFHMIHAFIDRYLIEFYISKEALGIYSASYNMATIICGTLTGGIIVAIVPIYLKAWKEHGPAETKKILDSTVNVYLLFSPAIICGLYLISEPLLTVLSTKEYAQHSYLLPIIATGILLGSSNAIFSAGLQIEKRTKRIFTFVIESAVLNTVLNVIFIPTYGIKAAAIITVLSYFWMVLRLAMEGQKTIKIFFNYLLLIRSMLYCTVMIVLCQSIAISNPVIQLAVIAITGSIIYITLILAFEKDIRVFALKKIKKISLLS